MGCKVKSEPSDHTDRRLRLKYKQHCGVSGKVENRSGFRKMFWAVSGLAKKNAIQYAA